MPSEHHDADDRSVPLPTRIIEMVRDVRRHPERLIRRELPAVGEPEEGE